MDGCGAGVSKSNSKVKVQESETTMGSGSPRLLQMKKKNIRATVKIIVYIFHSDVWILRNNQDLQDFCIVLTVTKWIH